MEFSSKTWYGGEVRAHASARDLAALECKPFDGLRRVAFVDVDGKEEFCGRVESYRNLEEAERVASIVASMVRAGVCSLDVGVISGYSAQVELIRICLELEGLSDRTVDGFQGQERKVIIFSGVRSKENLGFLSDHRRLNVMLTRAKQGLVVVGRRRTLELDSVWRDWLTSMNA
ncbi:AAA domain-containing protein [Chytriomyces sp. MP71]|nr:AAA domain-containing protein [Chytriomyces sp. MP71]